jgi:hypothetical protein
MKLVDLNVLLYIVNVDAPNHERVREWWQRTLDAEELVGLAWITLLGFLRVSTRTGVFPSPLSVLEACEQIEEWLSLANVRGIQETDQHWSVSRELLEQVGTAGNLTTDAHLAAMAICRDATLVSCDHDFRRFPKLRWENPAA